LCLEKWDCHPGLPVPFKNDVQTYFSGGIYGGDAMTVVALWQGESAPSVAPYGGAQRPLEAFLSTMAVWPASPPHEERTCYGHQPFSRTARRPLTIPDTPGLGSLIGTHHEQRLLED
jgi:hypothetical protein